MKKTVCVALLLFSVNCWAQDKGVSVETIQSMKRAIVPVLCGYLNNKGNFEIVQIAGTGFFIDMEGRFLTPAHVLTSFEEIVKTKHACTPAIYVPDHGWRQYQEKVTFQYFWFVSCESDRDADLAVCQAVENPFTAKRLSRENISAVTFWSETIPDGTSIAFTGFPLQMVSPITSKANIAGRLTTGQYLVDKTVWDGDSGSPVYTDDGKVVGMATARGQGEAAGLGLCKTSIAILDFLSKHLVRTERPKK